MPYAAVVHAATPWYMYVFYSIIGLLVLIGFVLIKFLKSRGVFGS